MKHIKEFNSYNESFLADYSSVIATYLVGGFLLYKFLKNLFISGINKLKNKLIDDQESDDRNMASTLLLALKNINKIPVSDLGDRFFMRVEMEGNSFDIRILKHEKILTMDNPKLVEQLKISLTDDEYDNLLKIIKK